MKTGKLPLTLLTFLLPWTASPQQGAPPPPSIATPAEMAAQPAAMASPAGASGQQPTASPLPEPGQAFTAAPSTATPSSSPAPYGQPEIRLNFQGAALSDVLNYLSEAAGFIIVEDVPVTGTVSVVSRQPMSADDAVDLLNAVLLGKGYMAIRNGRILKIESLKDAQTKDLPVITGADPDQIPRKDAMVTQILPVRYVDVSKLIENLRPLLSPDASITENDSSNAILLTDTQTNVHRIAEIIRALDTSVSSISTIHVYPLRYADAKELAGVITQLFATDQSKQNNNQPPFAAMRRMFGGGDGGPPPAPVSEARQAETHVVAVADEESNSVVVSAPDEMMETISEIVSRVDTNIADITETRIFKLLHADSVELAGLLTSLYGQGSTPQNGGNNGQQRPPQPQPQTAQTQRAVLQSRVVAVPDARTNSIIVSCSRDLMEQIALTVGRLDASDSKKQHVYIYTLDHADPDNVASILRGMFSVDNSADTSAQPSTSRLTERTTTGASQDVSDTLNTNSNSSSGRSGAFGR